MNFLLRKFSRVARTLVYVSLAWPLAVLAFPPAPNHTIYGLVRDQIGNPLDLTGAEITLESTAGIQATAPIVPGMEPGVNYRLDVPMDAGLTADLYKPTALLPAAPFRLRVRIGGTTFLPMEMTGNLAALGLPGARTRIDLTLGVDADGNGLPDAWEKAAAAFLGLQWSSGSIKPGDLYPGTGLTFRDVYLAGTYAVNPDDGFALKIIAAPGEAAKLAFTVVKGRAYTIQVAAEIGQWTTVPFRVLPLAADSASIDAYQATTTQRMEIEPPTIVSESPMRFYRLLVQ